MKKQRITYAAALAANAIIFFITNTRISLVTLFTMLIVPILSYIYLVYFVNHVKIESYIDFATEVGKEIYGHLEVYSPLIFIPGVMSFVCRYENKMFSKVKQQTFLVHLAGGGQIINIPFISDICGVTSMKISSVECRDMLSLFKRGIRFSHETDVTVYPARIHLETIFSHDFHIEHEGIFYDARRRGTDVSEILNIKDYVYGDNIRNIHWKLSSKLNKTMVREFARPNNLNVMIFCDVSLNVGEHKVSYEEISNNFSIAAAISHNMSEHGIPHAVCIMDAEMEATARVESLDDFQRILSKTMAIRLSNKPFDSVAAFSNLDIGKGISKVIYIAHEYSTDEIRLIANRHDLTIVQMNDGDKNVFSEYEGYRVISIAKDDLHSKVHTITL